MKMSLIQSSKSNTSANINIITSSRIIKMTKERRNIPASQINSKGNYKNSVNLSFYTLDLLFHNAPKVVRSGLKAFIATLLSGIVANSRSNEMLFVPRVVSNADAVALLTYLLEKDDAARRKDGMKSRYQDNCEDINRIVWVSRNVLKSMQIANTQWVQLKIEPFHVASSSSSTNKKGNTSSPLGNNVEELYLCQVCEIEPEEELTRIEQETHQFIRMTPTTYYNLRKHFRLVPTDFSDADIKLKMSPIISSYSSIPGWDPFTCWSFSPLKAKSLNLSRLKTSTSNDLPSSECDTLLKEYFKHTKYLSRNDIIAIPLMIPFDDDSHLIGSFTRMNIEFYVTDLFLDDTGVTSGSGCYSSHNYPVNLQKVYQVSSESSSLYLNSNEVSLFHVPIVRPIMPIRRNKVSNFESLQTENTSIIIPNVLQPHLVQIQALLRSAINMQLGHPSDNELWPTILIQGDIGSGKFSICSSLAKILGLNFLTINGFTLIGDTSAYTEAKLKALGEKIKSILPCLIYIRNIHLIGKDKEGHDDKRVVLAFKEFLSDVQHGTSLPISKPSKESASQDGYILGGFIVGSTSFPEEMSESLRNYFIHNIKIPSVVPLQEYASTIRWLIETANVGVSSDLDLAAWVDKSCHGVRRNMGDLRACLAYAIRNACENQQHNGSGCFVESPKSHVSSRVCCKTPRVRITEDNLDFGLGMVDKVLKGNDTVARIPNVTWEDVGGLGIIKSELINSIQLPLRFPKLFSAGIKRSGILLYGPPGTGKTLIAKAVATEFKLSFLSVKGPELLNMYVGQSEQNVREVFQKARESAPCVIFFDELDSLAPNRGRSGDSGGVMDRVVSQILAELDGTHSTPNVFVIGATNRPDLIDPALLRPGRFDKLLYVGINEDLESKVKILQAITRKFPLDESLDWEDLAKKLPSRMTGADIYSLCSDAYMTAVARCISIIEQLTTDGKEKVRVTVCKDDFEEALTRATVSISPSEFSKYEKLKTMMR